jgi:hypothetical protein
MVGLIDEVLRNSIGGFPGQCEISRYVGVDCIVITDKDTDVHAILGNPG